MSQYVLPTMYALFVWWFATGLALFIVGLPRVTRHWGIPGAIVLSAFALNGLAWVCRSDSAFGSYAAFTLAIVLWGAVEVTFLAGVITGPVRRACPVDCGLWQRTVHAVGAILYHELLLLAALGAVAAVSWSAPNPTGAWTFALLWVMRLSAKLNLFLGVPVTNDHLLPQPVAHLKSYFRKGPVSPFFPISVTLATVLTILLAQGALGAGVIRPEGLMLLAALSGLAVLEHWFMLLPLRIERLWGGGRPRPAPAERVKGAPVVTIIRVVQASRSPAFEAWTASAAQIDDRPSTSPGRLSAGKVHPHPALAKNRRRP